MLVVQKKLLLKKFVLKKNDPISINNGLNKALNVFLNNKKIFLEIFENKIS